jgi:hypothetical protein
LTTAPPTADEVGAGEEHVLEHYPRAVAHLRRQLDDGRLAVAFGAGASRPLGFPNWSELIDRVKNHPAIDGVGLAGTEKGDPLPTAAQVLLERFDRRGRAAIKQEIGDHGMIHDLVEARWRRIVQECLYKTAPADDVKLQQHDGVYKYFINVVKDSPITVNYNFDDTLERLLLHLRSDIERRERRGFEVVVDPTLPFRLKKGNILHINGFLPTNPLESVGERIVFAEGAFADQLVQTARGANATLLHFLTKCTFLLIGLSLQDENLRHLLRLNAIMNPGHFHYRVHFVEDRSAFDRSKAAELAEAHFRNFNLITLFLDASEQAGLGSLLSRHDLLDEAKRLGAELYYTIYLAGVPGAGKTTCFTHLSSLVAHDEWLEERIPEMSAPPGTLSPDEIARIDDWVLRQVGLKNRTLVKQRDNPGIGINIVDRCPLDALSFTLDPKKWRDKAAALRTAIADGMAQRPVHPGSVLLLVGDPRDLRVRAFKRNRQTDASVRWFQWLQDATCLVYKGKGVTRIDVSGMSIPDMVHRVAEAVFRDDYAAYNLDRRLRSFELGKAPVPMKRAPR